MKFVGSSPSFSRGQIGGTLRGLPGVPETIPETLSKPRSRSVENIHRLKDMSDFAKLQDKAPDILPSNETIESILRLLKQKPKVTQPQKVSVNFRRNQKQPLEVFCKNRCSYKFREFHRKTTVLEFLFNKVTDLEASNFIKRRPQQMHSCEIWENFKNTYFEKQLRTTASTECFLHKLSSFFRQKYLMTVPFSYYFILCFTRVDNLTKIYQRFVNNWT